MIITAHAFARAGLVGNPSDGYFGKTISFTIRNFRATVRLWESPHFEIVPTHGDLARFDSVTEFLKDQRLHGYYGGMRIIKAAIKKFHDYCHKKGVELNDRSYTVGFETEIPRLVGLSGSSAIVMAMLRALMQFHELSIPLHELPNLALSVEREELGISAGLQDRVVQAYEGIVYMDFDRTLLDSRGYGDYVPLAPAKHPPLYVAYDPERAEVSDVSHRNLRELFNRGDPAVLSAMQKYRELTDRGRDALMDGNWAELGQVMNANFDLRKTIMKVAPENLRMVEAARSTAPALSSAAAVEQSADSIGMVGITSNWSMPWRGYGAPCCDRWSFQLEIQECLSLFCLRVTMMPAVKKAVIPVAGFGTRMLPAAKAVPKELLPVLDRPTIQYVIEEAVAGGIDDVLLITSRDKKAIEDHFDRSPELEARLRAGGKESLLASINALMIKAKIHSVRQAEQRGLGDAVYQARHHIGNDSFLCMLGDTIFSGSNESPAKQLIDAAMRLGTAVIGLEEVPLEKVDRYGIIGGRQIESGVFRIETLVEKPSRESAPSRLAIAARYILTPAIFSCLENTEPGRGGEIQLTDALQLLLKREPIHGVLLSAKRHDIGNPIDWLKTNLIFAARDPQLRAALEVTIAELFPQAK